MVRQGPSHDVWRASSGIDAVLSFSCEGNCFETKFGQFGYHGSITARDFFWRQRFPKLMTGGADKRFGVIIPTPLFLEVFAVTG